MMETLQEKLKVELPKNIETEEARVFFDNLCKQHKVECKAPRSTTRLIDKLVNFLKNIF